MDQVLKDWTVFFQRAGRTLECTILERLIKGAKSDREEIGRLDRVVTTHQENEEIWRAQIVVLNDQCALLLRSNKAAAAKAHYTAEAVRRAIDLLQGINP